MYTQKDFSHLLGMTGFSDTLLNNHFTLYGAYVNNVNKIVIETLMKNKLEVGSIEKSEVTRRLGWEVNGMKLHELYFENLSKEKSEINLEGKLIKSINEVFGSFENFKNIFIEIGKMRGIGWAALVKGEREDELYPVWIDEHNTGLLANSKIILIMDVWEHAFITDYGIKRADYINAFWENINWKVCEERFEK